MNYDAIEVGSTYEVNTTGRVMRLAGTVRGITEEHIAIETYDYYHEVKKDLITSVIPITLEAPAESKRDILFRQNYVRVPTLEMANELIRESELLGYKTLLEKVELCDMACSGNGITYFLQIS